MHLLKYFKKLSLRPENAQDIRALILELAIRGRLTEEWRREHPDVEPASVLLERIRKEKARLVKEKMIRKEKVRPKISKGAYPVPENWKWCRLRDLGLPQTGTTPSKRKTEFWGTYIPFVNPGNIKNNFISMPSVGLSKEGLDNGRLIGKGSLLMVCIGGSIGKSAISKYDLSCNQQINTLTPIEIDVQMVESIVRAKHFQDKLIEKATGSATPIINRSKWENISIPLPPLPEQHAIVATVNRLLAEVDELERQTTQFHALRQDYVTASLRQLTGEDSSGAWAALRPHFQAFFDQQNGVDRLREAILELAVQGKLTVKWRAENPDVEPASVLLERIQEQKKLEKKVSQPKSTKRFNNLPNSWVICNFGEISEILNGKAFKKSELLDDPSLTPVLRVGNLFTSKKWYYSNLKLPADKVIDTNDLIYAWSASFGPRIWEGGKAIYHYHIWKLDHSTLVNKRYLLHFLHYESEAIKASGNGVAMVHMTKGKMEVLPTPLPPLLEQNAIVKIVDELMVFCDQLQDWIEKRDFVGADFLRASVGELLAATEKTEA